MNPLEIEKRKSENQKIEQAIIAPRLKTGSSLKGTLILAVFCAVIVPGIGYFSLFVNGPPENLMLGAILDSRLETTFSEVDEAYYLVEFHDGKIVRKEWIRWGHKHRDIVGKEVRVYVRDTSQRKSKGPRYKIFDVVNTGEE